MVVKAMQLKNAETLAVPYATGMTGVNGQQISYWNYWLMFIFMFGVQAAIWTKLEHLAFSKVL
jgi:hypothetical protein